MTGTKNTKLAKDTVWKMATNHLNLLMMSAMGIVPASSWLGHKYYQDSLAWADGFILVFKKVPQSILAQSTQEDPQTLKPCVVSFKKGMTDKLMTRQVLALSRGAWQPIDIDNQDMSDVECLLLPAPVSLSWVDYVGFADKSAQASFMERVGDSANALPLPSKVKPADFKPSKQDRAYHLVQNERPEQAQLATLPNHYELANALTAMVNHLMILANTNVQAVWALDYLKTGQTNQLDGLLVEICTWIRQLGIAGGLSNTANAFVHLLGALIEHKNNRNFASAKDVVLYSLRELSQGSEQSLAFVGELEGFVRLFDISTDALLGKYTKPLQRALILFVSRDDVLGLWQQEGIYSTTLNPIDVLLASLLFAADRGWQGLPRAFKLYADNTTASQDLFTQMIQGVSIAQDARHVQAISAPLQTVWTSNHYRSKTAMLVKLINTYGWDCAKDELVIDGSAIITAKGGKTVITALPNSIELKTVIDIPLLREHLSKLGWLDFKTCQAMQKSSK